MTTSNISIEVLIIIWLLQYYLSLQEVNLAYENVKEVDGLDVSKDGTDAWEAAIKRYIIAPFTLYLSLVTNLSYFMKLLLINVMKGILIKKKKSQVLQDSCSDRFVSLYHVTEGSNLIECISQFLFKFTSYVLLLGILKKCISRYHYIILHLFSY